MYKTLAGIIVSLLLIGCGLIPVLYSFEHINAQKLKIINIRKQFEERNCIDDSTKIFSENILLPQYPIIQFPNAFNSFVASPKSNNLDSPDYFNWRDYNGQDWTTPVKNQGNCGSCGIFSCLGAFESVINIRENCAVLDPDLSEQYVLSCIPAAGNCKVCAWNYLIFYYINATSADGNYNNGVIPESCFYYQADDSISCEEKCSGWKEKLVPLSSYGFFITNGTIEDRQAIKNQIMLSGPICANMLGTTEFFEWGQVHHSTRDYFPYIEASVLNHAVVIVGWKDDSSIDRGGYWICKNSWGVDWGYEGFFNIEYESLNIGIPFICWPDYDPNSVDWPPLAPQIMGHVRGIAGKEYTYTFSTIDPEENQISYYIDWGDNTFTNWSTTLPSREYYNTLHTWSEKGDYTIKAKARDIYGAESDWSTFEVTMLKTHNYNSVIELLLKLLERFLGRNLGSLYIYYEFELVSSTYTE